MIYQDFDLWMDKRQGDYYPLKAQSKMGSVTGKLSLMASSAEIAKGLKRLAENRTDKEFLKEFGGMLYDLVFQEKIDSLFQKSLGQVLTNQDEGLRIRLRITPPELNSLPWELLHDGKRFLSTSTKLPLTRFIELDEPIPELSTGLPIKVLIVIPEGSGLDTDKERDDIIGELNGLNQQGEVVGYKVLDGRVTRSEIRKALREERYHVFHFIGHGLFDGSEGLLALNSERGGAQDLIDAEAFGLFFQDYFSMKLVVLNSCQGANDSASKPLSGVAPHLISQGLPAVIAMQYPVPDKVAKLFAREFYSSLCVGADQGRVDTAISYARKSICQEFEHTKGFVIPVLLMRSPTGIIFDIQRHRPAITSVAELHLAKEVEKARANNIAALKSQEEGASLAEKEKIAARIEEEREEVIATKNKIRKWQRSILLRTLVIFLVASLAYWTHLFNLLNLDDWVERKFIAAVMEPHMQNKPFWDKLELILINDGDNGSAGAFDPKADPTSKQRWRENYASLIKGLSAAGAEMVILDINFDIARPPSSEEEARANSHLTAAFRAAVDKGTPVLVGTATDDSGNLKLNMPDDMVQALGGSWGLTDIFIQHNWTHLVRQVQLARRVNGVPSSGCAEAETRVFPSLALLAAMKSKQLGLAQPAAACLDEAGRRIILRDSDGRQSAIPVNDDRMIVTLDVANYDELLKGATSYQLALTKDGRLQDPSRYGGKIVIIGVRADGIFTTAADKWRISDSGGDPRDQWRYGPELHANILSNLLCEVHIVPLSPGQNLLVILLMILLGISMQTIFRGHVGRVGFTLRRGKVTAIPVAAFAVILSAYFLAVFISYKEWRLVFSEMNYHVVTLFITYGVMGSIRRKL